MLSRNQLLTSVFFVIVSGAKCYSEKNTTSVFNFFKAKYHKQYTNKAEEAEAYGNFVKNLNKVTALNGNPKEMNTIYTLNKYADIDPKQLEEHFGLNVSVYDVNNVDKGLLNRNRHLLRAKTQQPEARDLESLELYDLDDADELFKQYMTAFRKNYSKKHERTLHFYRFVKSLIEVNRGRWAGNKNKKLDENADFIDNPNAYFY